MKIKRTFLAVVFCSLLATSAYALDPVTAMAGKRVVLRANNRTVLVNRFTGNVNYILQGGQWKPLTGIWKKQCQALYNAQKRVK